MSIEESRRAALLALAWLLASAAPAARPCSRGSAALLADSCMVFDAEQHDGLHDALAGIARRLDGRLRRAGRRLWLQVAAARVALVAAAASSCCSSLRRRLGAEPARRLVPRVPGQPRRHRPQPRRQLRRRTSPIARRQVKFGVDAISAASDSCARCHPRRREQRPRRRRASTSTRKYGDYEGDARRRVQPRKLLHGDHRRSRHIVARSEQEQHDGGRRFRLLVQPAAAAPRPRPTESQHAVDALRFGHAVVDAARRSRSSATRSTRSTATRRPVPSHERERRDGGRQLARRPHPTRPLCTSPPGAARRDVPRRRLPLLPRHVGGRFQRAVARPVPPLRRVGRRRRRISPIHPDRRLFSTSLITRARRSTTRATSGCFRLTPTASPATWRSRPEGGLMGMPAGTALTLQYERYHSTTGFEAGIFTRRRPDSAQVTLGARRLHAAYTATCSPRVPRRSLSFHPRASVDTGQTRVFKYLMGTSSGSRSTAATRARQQAADEAFGAVAEVDRLMSDYRADSEARRDKPRRRRRRRCTSARR